MNTYWKIIHRLLEITPNVSENSNNIGNHFERNEDNPIEADVLIIDDLGTELVNTFTSTQLFYIINHRINAEKSTIISTNLSLKLLRDNYSDRIVSRFLSSYDIIKIYGEDIRKQKL